VLGKYNYLHQFSSTCLHKCTVQFTKITHIFLDEFQRTGLGRVLGQHDQPHHCLSDQRLDAGSLRRVFQQHRTAHNGDDERDDLQDDKLYVEENEKRKDGFERDGFVVTQAISLAFCFFLIKSGQHKIRPQI
jgi:hypothetical protein